MGAQSVSRFTAAGHGDALETLLEVLEQEAEDRRQRRIGRLRTASRLPAGKTWETFEHDRVPLALRQQLGELSDGSFVDRGVNVLAFGLPGTGKTHAQLRPRAEYLQVAYGVSERRACEVLTLPRASHRYRSVADEQAALKMRIRDLAQARVSYGYRRLHVLLQREGWAVNHKRVYRLYSQEGLMLRTKRPKLHVLCQRRTERPVASGIDESWSMDFMSDELFDGRRIRLLTIVDNFTRESLAIKVAASIKGEAVVGVLQRLMEQHRLPRTIRVDNGPEFTSKPLDQWAYLNGVELDFSRPGKPTDNAFIEAFNGRFRQECLNENWFLSLVDAQEKVESWQRHYNGEKPHSAFGNLSPREFAVLAVIGD